MNRDLQTVGASGYHLTLLLDDMYAIDNSSVLEHCHRLPPQHRQASECSNIALLTTLLYQIVVFNYGVTTRNYLETVM